MARLETGGTVDGPCGSTHFWIQCRDCRSSSSPLSSHSCSLCADDDGEFCFQWHCCGHLVEGFRSLASQYSSSLRAARDTCLSGSLHSLCPDAWPLLLCHRGEADERAPHGITRILLPAGAGSVTAKAALLCRSCCCRGRCTDFGITFVECGPQRHAEPVEARYTSSHESRRPQSARPV